MFELGVNCEHIHREHSCIACLTCFYFFYNKVLPFLKNDDYEVSSNDKYEVEPIMDSVTNLSNTVTRYASHHLRTNVKFYAIEDIIQSMKTDPSIAYMVPYQNQKVLQMRYCDGQDD